MDRQISLRLPGPLLRAVDRVARQAKISRSSLLRRILEERFDAGLAFGRGRPLDRGRHLMGAVEGGPPDLGRNSEAYLRELFRDRRG